MKIIIFDGNSSSFKGKSYDIIPMSMFSILQINHIDTFFYIFITHTHSFKQSEPPLGFLQFFLGTGGELSALRSPAEPG